jgi:hypothetical protein
MNSCRTTPMRAAGNPSLSRETKRVIQYTGGTSQRRSSPGLWNRWFADSSLERAGFEPLVPPWFSWWVRPAEKPYSVGFAERASVSGGATGIVCHADASFSFRHAKCGMTSAATYERLEQGPGQVLDRFLPARAAPLASAAQ